MYVNMLKECKKNVLNESYNLQMKCNKQSSMKNDKQKYTRE